MMHRRICSLAAVLCAAGLLWADDPVDEKKAPPPAESKEPETPPSFVLKDDVREALLPLFSSIAKAEVSRASVEMLVDALVGGTVIESTKSTYQIASQQPGKFTIYLKEPEQRTRIYCDGESAVVAVAPEAYFRLPEPISIQEAVTNLSVPLGPYPEPVLALTMAGVDPAISLVGGMKSIEIVDRKDFRGKIPSIHLRGVQADAVTWDFWITKDKRKPLRLLVDLTPMLIASDQLKVPENYSHQIRFDFLSWRVTGEVDEELFTYKPLKDAKEYESLEDYYASMTSESAEHPLLGKPAPKFSAKTLAGEVIELDDLKDKVVVLDFWATWCQPCLAAMPIIEEVTGRFADKDVVFLAVNTGETQEEIAAFVKEQEMDVQVVLDPEGKVADAYAADAIPQTILIGKNGAIESVHIGFLSEEALSQRLADELEVLSVGGRIATAPADAGE